MEQVSNQLYDRAVTKLTDHIDKESQFLPILLIVAVVAVVAILICLIVEWNKIVTAVKIFLIIGLAAVVVLDTIFFGIVGKDIYHDKKLSDQGEFIVIEGELVGFERLVPVNRSWHYTNPMIKENGTDNTITLKIPDAEKRMEIGSTYKVVYLPNTGYAEIIEGE